jgi:hypothetical protein
MANDLTKSNRYLLATLFKNKPGYQNEVAEAKLTMD